MTARSPRVTGLLETSLYVDDLDRAAAFYKNLFGFECFVRDERMCGLGVPGQSVLLLFRRGGSVQPSSTPGGTIPPHDGQGRLHLCFAIPWGELTAWQQFLEQQHLAIESRVTWPRGGVSLYFRDPDGNSVEVATPGLWPHH